MDASAAKLIGMGLAAIGMIGAGIGVGSVWASLIQAVGRNPAAKDSVQTFAYRLRGDRVHRTAGLRRRHPRLRLLIGPAPAAGTSR